LLESLITSKACGFEGEAVFMS